MEVVPVEILSRQNGAAKARTVSGQKPDVRTQGPGECEIVNTPKTNEENQEGNDRLESVVENRRVDRPDTGRPIRGQAGRGGKKNDPRGGRFRTGRHEGVIADLPGPVKAGWRR